MAKDNYDNVPAIQQSVRPRLEELIAVLLLEFRIRGFGRDETSLTLATELVSTAAQIAHQSDMSDCLDGLVDNGLFSGRMRYLHTTGQITIEEVEKRYAERIAGFKKKGTRS